MHLAPAIQNFDALLLRDHRVPIEVRCELLKFVEVLVGFQRARCKPNDNTIDLTRRGSLFNFHGIGTINQYAFYFQDAITAGSFLFNLGVRLDSYDGLVSKTEPR